MTELYVRKPGGPLFLEPLGVDLATPEDIVAAFNALPREVKARATADVVDEHQLRHRGIKATYSQIAVELRQDADRWEAEDAEKADQEAKVEELAQVMRGDYPGWDIISADLKDEYRAHARAALEWMQGQQK